MQTAVSSSAALRAPCRPAVQRQGRRRTVHAAAAVSQEGADGAAPTQQSRRAALAALAAAAAAATRPPSAAAFNADYTQTASGLLVQDITTGSGAQPRPGDVCVVHWAGRTKNYQAKIIDNTSKRDEPFTFKLGSGEVIPAFDEAVAGMRVGGVRRIEVLGEIPELSYPRDPSQRFSGPFKYRYGPQPSDLGGQRALDFVLDNPTLDATNRTLLFDIKLLAVRPAK